VTPPRAAGVATAAWRGLVASWPAMTTATIAASLALAPRPATWRRPVRDEFWRFAGIAGPGSLGVMVMAAVLVGVGLVGQSVFWLGQVADTEALRRTILVLLIREVTPLTVGVVSLGRAGLANLHELGAMRANGTVRALAAQGVDPFVLLVLPRVLALGLCILAHAVVFLVVAFLVGYASSLVLGAQTAHGLFFLARETLSVLGEVGVLVLPVKTLLIGFAIAGVTAATVLYGSRPRDAAVLVSSGFFRALLAIFVISLLGSLIL
jgi:phospholipid/cholesterol/gamma-HCH transport system permease protein